MNIEYQLLDIDFSEADMKDNILKAVQYGIKDLCVSFAYTKFCKNLIKDTNITVSNPIDYPLGLSDTESRLYSIQKAIKNGAQKINIVIQNQYLVNRKYEKIKYDIQKISKECLQNSISLNYYIDYRIFTHQSLIKACSMLVQNGVKNVYVSTGHFMDNPEDNMIATILLRNKTGINTIFSGNICTRKHIDALMKNNIDHINVNNIQSIKMFYDEKLL